MYKQNRSVIPNNDLAVAINVNSGTPLLTVGPLSAKKVCWNQASTNLFDLYKTNKEKIIRVGKVKGSSEALETLDQYL